MENTDTRGGQNIYDPTFVNQLFENMSGTYNRTNIVTSFGFCLHWRRQCVNAIPISANMPVVDLMTGIGEAWPYILLCTKSKRKTTGIDFCKGMVRFQENRKKN